MNTSEIVAYLKKGICQWSPLFSTQLSATGASIDGSGNILVQTATAHGLVVNDSVSLSGFYESVDITGIVQDGNSYTITTGSRHDLTKHESDPAQYVLLKTENYPTDPISVLLTDVANRFTFTVSSEDALFDTDQTGSLQQYHYGAVNSTATVTAVPDTTSLVLLPSSSVGGLPTNLGEYLTLAKVNKSFRVAGAIDIQTAINSYTAQPDESLWLFAIIDNYSANRSKFNTNDAQDMTGRQQDFRQQIIGNFSIYCFVPNKGDILTKTNGRAARDIIETIRAPLFKSILNIPLSTALTLETQNSVTYAGDGYFNYAGPYYIHRFQFQQVMDITYPDTASAYTGGDRAFRDIDLNLINTFSTDNTGNPDAEYGVGINLDREPV